MNTAVSENEFISQHNPQAGIAAWARIIDEAVSRDFDSVQVAPCRGGYAHHGRRGGQLALSHLQLTDESSSGEFEALVAHIKALAGIDITARQPQHGQFVMEHAGKQLGIQVSTLPMLDGERVLVRIRDTAANTPALDELGITRLAEWREAVQRGNGLFLVCGTTHSGKGTTLAATVKELQDTGCTVYSLANQEEFGLALDDNELLSQQAALDIFSHADPDVVVARDVRDIKTLREALTVSEGGRLTFATVHASSARGAVERLHMLGASPEELRKVLRGVLVQRLVRGLCQACSGEGCVACASTGYTEFEAASEVACFKSEADVQALLEGKVSWPTMQQDAKAKVLAGKTSESEVVRVFGVSLSEIE